MIGDYVLDLSKAILGTVCTEADGRAIEVPLVWFQGMIKRCNRSGGTVYIIGNGGSAAIASHVAIDLCKAAGMRATALNDASMLTCLSNDYGYHLVFDKQLEYRATNRDALIAISSSGESASIICAIERARKICMAHVVTFTGFDDDNDMRHRGDFNFYTPSHSYGHVELAHHAILHAVTDALALDRAQMAVIKGDDWTPTVETVDAQ